MKPRLEIALLVASLLAATGAVPGEEATPLAEVAQRVEAHRDRHQIPGVSVGLVVDGEPLWAMGFGLSDLENQVPATEHTVYRLASVSKAITAVSAMKLAQEGVLELDKPVRGYIEAWPEKRWPITTRQLLGHLGGVRHYRPGEVNSTKTYGRLELGLGIFADDPLLQQPGKKFVYTTYGYTLAGCAMEKASGKGINRLLKECVFEPAGMVATRDDSVAAIIPHRARGYRKVMDKVIANARPADTSYKIPGGGLCGTAPDLARFAAALMDGTLLDDSSVEAMWTEGRTEDGEPTSYALGWQLSEYNGLREFAHGGAQQGTSSYLYLCPQRNFAAVVLCNLERARPKELAYEIARLFLD